MTLIVALGCSDGLVMAAESASSDILTGTKQSVTKIQQLGSKPIIFGGSGDAGLIQKLVEALSDLRIPPSSKFNSIRRLIRHACLPEIRDAAVTHVRQFIPGCETPPTAVLLFGCIQNKTPYILEIDADAKDTVYDKNLGWFQAIGSGRALAQAIIRPHLTRERDLELGKILAYRLVEDSIELALGGLAKPIRLYTLTLDGSFTELDNKELENLEKQCQLWRELEGEALGNLLAPPRHQHLELLPEPEL